MEEHFFFTNEGERLFGVLHTPVEKSRDGFVFCHPFAEERQEAHRVMVNFARLLAESGWSVVRFDYRGTGDSGGEFGDCDFNSRVRDIIRATEILREKAEVENIGLLGLRLGATLAAVAAKEAGDVRFLVLWAPILSVKAYLDQFLRRNLTMQMALYKEIRTTREELIRRLMGGENVNVQGYSLSGKLYRQAVEVDLVRDYSPSARSALVVNIARDGARPNPQLEKLVESCVRQPDGDYLSVSEEPFWLEQKYYVPKSEILSEKTIEWISSVR